MSTGHYPTLTITGVVTRPGESWPRCLYNPDAFCGEWQDKSLEAGWTNLCQCPSCPIKCLARDAAARERKRAEA